jgi:hypothetical protein
MKNHFGRCVASIMPPESIGATYRGWIPCIDWCTEMFGVAHPLNGQWLYIGEGVFEFTNERDLTAFLLKWS